MDGQAKGSSQEQPDTPAPVTNEGEPIVESPGEGPLIADVWSPAGIRRVTSVDEVAASFADTSTRIWVDVEDASDETLKRLAEILELHHLVAEDIIERNQRAKIVYMDEGLHLVLFAMHYDGGLSIIEVDIVLGRRFLLTSHPRTWRPLETLDLNFRGGEPLLAQGTDLLLYAVVDPIVDGYFPVIDRISDEIDRLEDDVVERPDRSIVERLFRLRRSLLEVRHAVSPERDIFNQLSNRDVPLIDPSHKIYFRDVYDLTIRVTDELDTHRELVGGVLDAYLSTVNNNLSDVMKRLTAVTAVLAGVGAAAGIFGMSEAASALGLPPPLGFWLVAGAVALIGVAVFAYFRRIDWI